MSTEIKTNLFSFKTFRSPDKITPQAKNQFFVFHPNQSESAFSNVQFQSIRDYNSFIDALNPVASLSEFETRNNAFYNFSCSLMSMINISSLSNSTIRTDLNFVPLSDSAYLEVWEELLAQLITQKSLSVRQACINMIITQFCVTRNTPMTYGEARKIAVVIPDFFIDVFYPWKNFETAPHIYGVYNLGIQDYRRVEQTLIGYVPGEVSHIENVMASEYKEKTSRNFLRTEEETELSSETAIENLNDTTTTERDEMSSEIAKLVEKDKSFNMSGSVTVSKDSMFFGSISANVTTGYNSNNSSSLSNTEAKNYAKEKTEQARERIEQKVSERRTYKMIKEFEETSKHGYDNRGGTQHVTGVYRWIDKIYRNQLVNYGKRLLLEVEVPHPSILYKMSLKWKQEQAISEQDLLVEPKTLESFGIRSYNDITKENDNIISAATYYGVSIQSYESEEQYITVDIPQTEVSNESFTESSIHDSVQLPQGMVADRIDGHGLFNYNTPTGTAYIEFDFGSGCKKYVGDYSDRSTKNFDFHFSLTNKIAGSVPFIVRYRCTNYYSATYIIKCVADPALYRDWQEEVYSELLSAYHKKMEAYNEALKLQQAQKNTNTEEGIYSNASMNRLIEERELKRSCIEMLGSPYGYQMGKCFYTEVQANCSCIGGKPEISIPQINQSEEMERYAQYVKFFETVFQWEIMSYVFYPYYYSPQCKWYELMQTKSENDLVFEAFLQSGLAKVLVPVRPQFEKAVLWYIKTGEIYTEGNIVAGNGEEQDLSLVSEIQNQGEEVVEDTWETRIPSTLTIIQAKSTYLEDENGLPCAEGETSEFGSDDTTLQGLNAQTETPEEETGGESRETIL